MKSIFSEEYYRESWNDFLQPKETIEKMIEQADRKSEQAYMNYQETGAQRYEREWQKAEDLGDSLRMALSAYDDHAKLVALKAELMILANDADNILAHGVVEDCEDVVIRFLHLAEHYCGMHFEGLPEPPKEVRA